MTSRHVFLILLLGLGANVTAIIPDIAMINDVAQDFIMDAKEFIMHLEQVQSQGAGGTGFFSELTSLLGQTSYAHGLSLSAAAQLEALKRIKDTFGLSKLEMETVIGLMAPILKNSTFVLSEDQNLPIPAVEYCPFPKLFNCDRSLRYRTYDGSCNHVNAGLLGRSMTPLKRYLAPDYGNGIDTPRQAFGGGWLPSAREVSRLVFPSESVLSKVHTLVIMTFAQIVDHDLSRTAATMILTESGAIVSVGCGEDGCDTTGDMNRACDPIPIDHNKDMDFEAKSCLEFTHTQPVLNLDCLPAGKDQLNQLTSYIDASNVYGSNTEEALRLRDWNYPTRGKLLMIPNPNVPDARFLLPLDDPSKCHGDRCFTSGDGRVNEQVGLTAMHTVWSRWHNVLEDRLYKMNPHWNAEVLYQETRRIVGAVMQVVIFKEFLPLTLGPHFMRKYNLPLKEVHFCDEYAPRFDPSIANGFATAAYRFGHSLVASVIPLTSPDYKTTDFRHLSEVFEDPKLMFETDLPSRAGAEAIMYGQISHKAEAADAHISPMLTKHLFTEEIPFGHSMDLGALNIQRGRDHGIPGYNKYREWCGLTVASNFGELEIPEDTKLNISRVYRHVDDIDLFAGGMAEEPVPGGMVGPTFACIIGQQFHDLKHGDRFWHENNWMDHSFYYKQVEQLRKMSLASILCDTLDDMQTIQPYVMLRPMSEVLADGYTREEAIKLADIYKTTDNERVGCYHIPRMDISMFYDYDGL